MHHLVHAITDLGDSALLVPASAMLLAYFLYTRSTRTAGIWASTLALCACLTLFLKLALYACGTDLPLADLRSPSGHTSVSVTFYGCCALMMSAERERWERLALVSGSAAVALAIAMSRVMLEAHTVGDVVVGFTIGAFCVAWFGACYLRQPAERLPWQPAVVAFGLVVLAMHGEHWRIEAAIAHVARLLHAQIPFCS